jgi:hypothetical protein
MNSTLPEYQFSNWKVIYFYGTTTNLMKQGRKIASGHLILFAFF